MQVQAPVVHIDGTNHRLGVIACKYLCMDKARCILINLYTCLQKLRVVGTRQQVRINLIRDVRHDDDRLNAALRRKGQRRDHITVQDQVGCHHMHIVTGFI